jgi:hypothetical protein
MSCTELSFTYNYVLLGSGGISITIDVSTVYECTNIQLRYRDNNGTVINDWFDYAVLTSLSTTINFALPPDVCNIDIRLNQCCPEPPPVGPDPPIPPGGGGEIPEIPDDPPCVIIADPNEDACYESVSITNPYLRPEDSSITQEYNDIVVPKQLNLTITHNSCSDISALLCSPRCTPPEDPTGQCACKFNPYVNIEDLPSTVSTNRTPYGVPLDIDFSCTYGSRGPTYDLPQYNKIEAYSFNYGFNAMPTIDGMIYDNSSLNSNTLIKIKTASNSEELRQWLVDHFRFFGINPDFSIRMTWPYTDLYWYPYDLCVPSSEFTAEAGVVYVNVVPC